MKCDFDKPKREKMEPSRSMDSVRFDYVRSCSCTNDSIENCNEAALN